MRSLHQGSERKKERMLYADPADHNFSYNRRYIGDGIQMREPTFAQQERSLS